MHLYNTKGGVILDNGTHSYLLAEGWDTLVNRSNLHGYLVELAVSQNKIEEERKKELLGESLLPPIGSQEVWAAGVTYLRSRDARMEESQDQGAADCYQRVYEAERPEIFFKSLARRVAGPGQLVHIRRDSAWNVPEPELALYINSEGEIQGFTIGNDMSSRSIEGENPLYLPQAKVYDRSAALGPCLYVPATTPENAFDIYMSITRNEKEMFAGSTNTSRMKRGLAELASYLCNELSFEQGAYLMTGTCLVPENDFTLQPGDLVTIRIADIGTLVNTVAYKSS